MLATGSNDTRSSGGVDDVASPVAGVPGGPHPVPGALDPATVTWLLEQDDTTLRAIIAQASGIHAAREGASPTILMLHNVASAVAPGASRRRLYDIGVAVAQAEGVTLGDLRGESRFWRIVHPRQHFMYAARAAGHEWTRIGRFLNRNHTTAIHGAKAHAKRVGQ